MQYAQNFMQEGKFVWATTKSYEGPAKPSKGKCSKLYSLANKQLDNKSSSELPCACSHRYPSLHSNHSLLAASHFSQTRLKLPPLLLLLV